MFRAKYGKYKTAPKNTDMQRWTKNFKEAGVLSTERSADQEGLIDNKLSEELNKIQSSH